GKEEPPAEDIYAIGRRVAPLVGHDVAAEAVDARRRAAPVERTGLRWLAKVAHRIVRRHFDDSDPSANAGELRADVGHRELAARRCQGHRRVEVVDVLGFRDNYGAADGPVAAQPVGCDYAVYAQQLLIGDDGVAGGVHRDTRVALGTAVEVDENKAVDQSAGA